MARERGVVPLWPTASGPQLGRPEGRVAARLGTGIIQRLGHSHVWVTGSLGPPVGSPGWPGSSQPEGRRRHRAGTGIVQAEMTVSPVTSLCLS